MKYIPPHLKKLTKISDVLIQRWKCISSNNLHMLQCLIITFIIISEKNFTCIIITTFIIISEKFFYMYNDFQIYFSWTGEVIVLTTSSMYVQVRQLWVKPWTSNFFTRGTDCFIKSGGYNIWYQYKDNFIKQSYTKI